MKPGAPFSYSTRWLTQLREWILGTHYMLKNLNFNLIKFLFIQFDAALTGCAQVFKPPRCTPAAPAGHRLRASSHPAR
jgi:hypothetical protein